MRHIKFPLLALACAISLSCDGESGVTPQPKPAPPKIEWATGDPVQFIAGTSATVQAFVTATSCTVSSTPQGLTLTPVFCDGATPLSIGISGVSEGNFTITLHATQNGLTVQSSKSVVVERRKTPEIQIRDTSGVLNRKVVLAPDFNGDVDGCRARLIGASAVNYGREYWVQDQILEVGKCRYELTLGNYVLRDGVQHAEVEIEGYSSQAGAGPDVDTVQVQRIIPKATDVVLSGALCAKGYSEFRFTSPSGAFIINNGKDAVGTSFSMSDPDFDPVSSPPGASPTWHNPNLVIGGNYFSGFPNYYHPTRLLVHVTNSNNEWDWQGWVEVKYDCA